MYATIDDKVSKRNWRGLPGDIVKNIIVGPGLYEGLQGKGGSPDDLFYEDWQFCEAVGQVSALALGVSASYGGLSVDGPTWAHIISTFSILAGFVTLFSIVWAPIFGVVDRVDGIYRLIQKYKT